jgi:glycine amidinotransferase
VTNESTLCPVNSHNEWDPLEEVIVGSLEGAMFAEAEIINKLFPRVNGKTSKKW